MSLIVPAKYVREVEARIARRTNGHLNDVQLPATADANKGALNSNLVALGRTRTPNEQRDLIYAMLGDEMPNLQCLGNRLLVATYIAPQEEGQIAMKMPDGSEIIADYDDEMMKKNLNANRYEGKVGLVIALGPTAFKYDGVFLWEGPKPTIGDWVWYRASDAPERGINNVYCRMIADDRVEGITADPRLIW